MKAFVVMQRDSGSLFWDKFTSGPNLPNTPTIQALIRHYLLEDRMADVPCKTYAKTDTLWTEAVK